MRRYKIQSHQDLRDEMLAVVRGERAAPKDAALPSFNSVEAVTRLLTPENRELLALLRDKKPQSIAELAKLSGRASPNLTRTLAKLEAAGLVETRMINHRKVPVAAVKKLRIEIDPFAQNDKLEIA